MIYDKKPPSFNPKFEITGSFIEADDKLLLLHRLDHKPEGNTWGVPAGKRNAHEDLFAAVSREVREETGLTITPKDFSFLATFYTRFKDYDFIYHQFIYKNKSGKQMAVRVNLNEHKGFAWVTPKEALKMPLIEDIGQIIARQYNPD